MFTSGASLYWVAMMLHRRSVEQDNLCDRRRPGRRTWPQASAPVVWVMSIVLVCINDPYDSIALRQLICHLPAYRIMSKFEDLVLLVDTPSASRHDVEQMRSLALVSELL